MYNFLFVIFFINFVFNHQPSGGTFGWGQQYAVGASPAAPLVRGGANEGWRRRWWLRRIRILSEAILRRLLFHEAAHHV
jgi:hypothetical protein